MSTQNSAEAPIVAGWTAYRKLTPQDQKVFNEAMREFIEGRYTPQTVSTQVITGTNYRFKCETSFPPVVVMPSDVVWESVVEIFQPVNGMPHITGIIRL